MSDDDPLERGDIADRFDDALEGDDDPFADEERERALDDEAGIWESEPVTSPDDESVESGIESDTPSAGGRDIDATPEESSSMDEADDVVSCRACKEAFESVAAFEREHKFSCEAQFSLAEEINEATDAGADEPRGREDLVEYLIDPQWHEFRGYIKYDGALDVYFGLNSLQKESDWDDSAVTTEVEFDNTVWEVEFTFKDSGIKPRPTLDFQLQNVREYLVKVHPRGCEHDEGGIPKATFSVSPRWPDIETQDGSPSLSNPHDIEGLDVEFNGSNLDIEDYPVLFQEALAGLRDLQGRTWSSPTYIPTEAVAPERIHESSNIVDAELYVRLMEEKSGALYAEDGPIHRLSLLLVDERSGYAKSVRDDTECAGYYHTATIGTKRASEVIGDHRLGKEIKHYHMRNPENQDGATAHPKFGVSLQNSRTDDTVYWHERDRLERELDEVLLNCLEWAGIPTRPDGQYYVEDNCFEAEGRSRFRRLVDNPLPRLESEQRGDVLQVMANLAPTDGEVLDHLVTDGGRHSPADIAQGIGRATSTVYKSLKRLGDVVDHQYGDVQLRSKCVAQEVVGLLDDARDAVDASLSGAVEKLVQAERAVDKEETAWDRWRNRYGVRLTGEEDEYGREILRMGFKPADVEAAKEIVRSGARYWYQVTGRKHYEFGYEFLPEIETVEDDTWTPYNLAVALR